MFQKAEIGSDSLMKKNFGTETAKSITQSINKAGVGIEKKQQICKLFIKEVTDFQSVSQT